MLPDCLLRLCCGSHREAVAALASYWSRQSRRALDPDVPVNQSAVSSGRMTLVRIRAYWVKRDSVSAVPNLRLSSSLHSSPLAWLANFSTM